MRNAEKMVQTADLTMVQPVCFVILCNTNQQWCFLFSSSRGYSKGFICFLEHNCCAQGDKLQSQSFVMQCKHCKPCLKYIFV